MSEFLNIRKAGNVHSSSKLEDVLLSEGLKIIRSTENELEIDIEAGEIDFSSLNWVLLSHGYELIYDQEQYISERVRYLANIYLNGPRDEMWNFSDYLSENLGKSYNHITKVFSKREGITIEKYFIRLKIDRAIEMLTKTDITLSEIAWKLGYKSVQHLSTQFKKETGKTFREFRESPERGSDPGLQ